MGEEAWEPLHFELEFLSSAQETSLIIFSLKIMFTTTCFIFSDRVLPWKIVDSQDAGIIKIRMKFPKSSGSNPHSAQNRDSEEDELLFKSACSFMHVCMCHSLCPF